MEDIKEKINRNYFDLTAMITQQAIAIPRYSNNDCKEVNRRFANSKMVELFSDCTDNFESSRLRKIILDKNK